VLILPTTVDNRLVVEDASEVVIEVLSEVEEGDVSVEAVEAMVASVVVAYTKNQESLLILLAKKLRFD